MDWSERCARAERWMRAAASCDEARLARFQTGCAGLVRFDDFDHAGAVWIAGVDALTDDDCSAGAVALFRAGEVEPVEVSVARRPVAAPYRFGFLAFRELEAIFAAAGMLSRRPDLVFYDGNGVLHPRGFGSASQFGLFLDVPTLGVSKNARAAAERAGTRGHVETVEPGRGAFVTTRAGVKPVLVSPGHRMRLGDATAAVLANSRHRIPEPLRAADRSSRNALAQKRAIRSTIL